MTQQETKEYTFKESFPLEKKGFLLESFIDKVKEGLMDVMLKDNFFINKSPRGEDYFKDIIPTRLKKIDSKEEEFLLNLINKYKIPVSVAGIYLSASFRIMKDQESIFSSFYKQTFVVSSNLEAFNDKTLIQDINNYTKEREVVNKIYYALGKNRQTYKSNLYFQNYINFLDTVFPIIHLM